MSKWLPCPERMWRTRSIPCTKPPSTASHSSLPAGGSPRSARMLRQPCAFASWKSISYVEISGTAKHTLRAMSTFSLGMLVQVRCIHVSIPIKLWQVLTSSEVSSDVRPPAFLVTQLSTLKSRMTVRSHHVISMNSGPNARIRSIRSNRFCKPWWMAQIMMGGF